MCATTWENATRKCLKLLVEGKSLEAELINECMHEIISGKASNAQIGSLLSLLKADTVAVDILHACSTAMLSYSLEFPASNTHIVLDIVGTGGDATSTFNASTAAAFLVASLGVKVAKHGNRSSSGRCGSADLVEALGANIMLDNSQLLPIFNQTGFAFLFAPVFHPAMGAVAKIRKEMGIRTIFNLLGPLTNPANPTHMLVGVGSEHVGNAYAAVLAQKKGLQKAIVVCSHSGFDEIGIDNPTTVWYVEAGSVKEKTIVFPDKDFGVSVAPVESFSGGTPEFNANSFNKMLAGEEGPATDFLLVNAAAALVLVGKAISFREGVDVARRALKNNTTKEFVNNYVQATKANKS